MSVDCETQRVVKTITKRRLLLSIVPAFLIIERGSVKIQKKINILKISLVYNFRIFYIKMKFIQEFWKNKKKKNQKQLILRGKTIVDFSFNM
jgi:hypothetical protein